MRHARPILALCLAGASLAGGVPQAAAAGERDAKFFEKIEGRWSGPGEIVAGKYKGTKFVCNFEGSTPDGKVGMALDGGCRVGMFTQNMSATVERSGGKYAGTFLDGANGKGLDVIGGDVSGRKAVFALTRKALNGAMLAHLTDANTMNITISVRVDEQLVPVIGVNLKRAAPHATGAIATR